HAGTLHADLSFDVGADLGVTVHDSHRNAATRATDRQELARAIESQRGLPGPDRDGEGRLGEPVAGCHDVLETELLFESADGARPYGLGSRERLLERGEIEAARVVNVPHAVPVPEVWGDGERGADPRHQLEPYARALQVGGQEIEPRAGPGRRERAADQPH